MSRTLRLFLYGTLQPRAQTPMARWMERRLLASCPAGAPGRIVAMAGGNGWFPALVPAGAAGRVVGTLCEIALAPGELARLDRYEGREYRRRCLPVRTATGVLAAQVYVWRIALPDGALPIASGDFLGWLEQTGRRPFSTLRNGA